MNSLPVLFLLLQAAIPAQIPPDSAESLRRLARRAEREYEFLLRSLAPARHGSTGGGECDEVVGRFCLRYGDEGPEEPGPEEPGRVARARQLAIEQLRRAFSALPGELTTAGPLLRYLVEDGRADEALAVARTFTWASRDSTWGPLLEGYALHASGEDSAAEHRFDVALAHLRSAERRRLERLDVLLSAEERRLYRRLSAEEQSAYEAAVWRLADPLYLTPGNERRAEHLARHVWSRLLAEAPVVRYMTSWGDDLDELTLRYGVPTWRERLIGWSVMAGEGVVEHYDPGQLAFLPEALRGDGYPPAPPPGDRWPLENERARSGYAPAAIRRLLPLEHQLSRFPAGDSLVLRLDGALPLDSAARAQAELRAGLFILDEEFRPARERLGDVVVAGDTGLVTFEVVLPAGRYVYSLEALERENLLAGRARYSVELPALPLGSLALSDIVAARPFGAGALPTGRSDHRLRPRPSLIVAPDDTLGLYAEAHGLLPAGDRTTRYRVALAVRPAREPALVARALRWLGRSIGLIGPRRLPSLEWEGQGKAGSPAILAVDLPVPVLTPGLYAVDLVVADLVGGTAQSATRLVRVRGIRR